MKKIILCGLALAILFGCQISQDNDEQLVSGKSGTRNFPGTIIMNDAQLVCTANLNLTQFKDVAASAASVFVATDRGIIKRSFAQAGEIYNDYNARTNIVNSHSFELLDYTNGDWGLVGIYKDSSGQYYFTRDCQLASTEPVQAANKLQTYIPGLSGVVDMQAFASRHYYSDGSDYMPIIRLELLVSNPTIGTTRKIIMISENEDGSLFYYYSNLLDHSFGGAYTTKCYTLKRDNYDDTSPCSALYMDGYYYKYFTSSTLNSSGLIDSTKGEEVDTDVSGKILVHGYTKNGTTYSIAPKQIDYVNFVSSNPGFYILNYETSNGTTVTSLVWLAESNITFPCTQSAAPAAPTSPIAAAAYDPDWNIVPRTIQFRWTDSSSNEEKFIVERKISGGTYSQIAVVIFGGQSIRDYNLTTGTRYYYRVKAANCAGNSAYTSEVSAIAQ